MNAMGKRFFFVSSSSDVSQVEQMTSETIKLFYGRDVLLAYLLLVEKETIDNETKERAEKCITRIMKQGHIAFICWLLNIQ